MAPEVRIGADLLGKRLHFHRESSLVDSVISNADRIITHLSEEISQPPLSMFASLSPH